jgi:DNA polymerase-4
VGAVSQQRLHQLGLATIGDVARAPETFLCKRLGEALGQHIAALARGDDSREVVSESEPVSIGHEETFDRDLGRLDDLIPTLVGQADRVAGRLRRAGLRARVVMVKIKHADFRLLTRRRTLDDATSDGALIGRVAVELAGGVDIADTSKRTRVRLCGVAVSGLESRDGPRQLGLDEPRRQRGERLGDAIDRIRQRFGDDAVQPAIATAGVEADQGTPKPRRH